MSANAEARQNTLDRALDAHAPSAELGQELFSVADALAGSSSLRRALTDSGTPEDHRLALVRSLFGERVSAAALSLLEAATKLQWATTGAMTAAVERQGVRAILSEAQRNGQLDEVEDQLFKVGRAIDANRELRAAIGERRVLVEGRQQLLNEVLGDKVLPATRVLAERAVGARMRTFDLTLTNYMKTTAELRNRAVATVEVARPLTAEQTDRLRAALARQAGREVTLNIVVNPAVLGGVRVSMGDEVIEGTVAGRLSDARRKLS